MRNTFKSRVALGGEVLHGVKLAQAEFISKRHYLSTTLEVYEVTTPDRDPFIITARNHLGWRQLYSGQTLAECLDWLKSSRLPAQAVTEIAKALEEKPQPKRGRPAKPKVTYCSRRRRDGSEITVTVGRGL